MCVWRGSQARRSLEDGILGRGGIWGMLGEWDVEQGERRARSEMSEGRKRMEEMKADKG